MSNMKNIPGKIYLQIGDECDSEDFNELSEVSWCKDKIYDNDIEYTLQNQMSNITEKEIEKLSEERYPVTDIIGNWLDIPTRNKQEGYIEGYKAALQNKVSEKCKHKSLADTGAGYYYCPDCDYRWTYSEYEEEENEVSDISAEKWKVFSHTSALGNTGDYISDCGIENGTISFYCDKPDDITNEELQEICDKLNASIVNERKDNVGVWVKTRDRLPDKNKVVCCRTNYKKLIIANLNSNKKPNEYPFDCIDEKVVEWLDESRVQSDNVGDNDVIEFADWLNKNASRNADGSWGYFGNIFYTKTSKELYDIFKSESQPQQKEV